MLLIVALQGALTWAVESTGEHGIFGRLYSIRSWKAHGHSLWPCVLHYHRSAWPLVPWYAELCSLAVRYYLIKGETVRRGVHLIVWFPDPSCTGRVWEPNYAPEGNCSHNFGWYELVVWWEPGHTPPESGRSHCSACTGHGMGDFGRPHMLCGGRSPGCSRAESCPDCCGETLCHRWASLGRHACGPLWWWA